MNGHRRIDLHTHTTCSDSTVTPAELVKLAARLGVDAIAVTDHDTMAAVAQAQSVGAELGVEVLAGVELTCGWDGEKIHLRGYGLCPEAPALQEILQGPVAERTRRNRGIAALMQADGMDVTLEMLERRHPGATIGRPHFAGILMEQGRADSVNDAFRRYLGAGCPYFLPRQYLPLSRGVEMIRRCGGVAVLAHPLQYQFPHERLRRLTEEGKRFGIAGMEVYYSGYLAQQREVLQALAAEFGLFVTGGSDFHGATKPAISLAAGYGNLSVPEECLVNLKREIALAQEKQ